MTRPLTLLAVLAHPDDESLGFGGTLARYAAEGVEVALVTATRGERGRYGHARPGDTDHPGAEALGDLRELELRGAARALGIRDVSVLSYGDAAVDQAEPRQIIGELASHIRRVRPHVVLTFGPDGAYGHPDHIAISQFTSAAVVAAADASFVVDNASAGTAAHAISKLYYLAWPSATWDAYQHAFKTLVSTVDGIERHAVPWPEWAITTKIETESAAAAVWSAVQCHTSQVSVFDRFRNLSERERNALWGPQYFYRAWSIVNGGRGRETDLFEGIRR